jgi:2-dehydro-3-deoxygluconokinase
MDSSTPREPNWDLTTVGELLGVFTPVSRGPLEDVTSFERGIGGAEVNVAIGLARLGSHVQWCGRVGADSIGRDGLRTLRAEGVDIRQTTTDPGAPTGIYVKEFLGPEGVKVSYYRANSAATRMTVDDFDTNRALDCRILHLTGITPLLSASCYDLTMCLADEAQKRGVAVSFDANVRHGLLGDREPRSLLLPLVDRADLVFLSANEAALLFGTAEPSGLRARQPTNRRPTVVVHDGTHAFALEPNGTMTECATQPVAVVDPVGAGDAFVSGYLSGWLRSLSPGLTLTLAHTCASRVVGTRGDNRGLPHEADALACLDDEPTTTQAGLA